MPPPPRTRRWSWRSQAFRGVVYQIVTLALLLAAGGYLLHNTLDNMRLRGIQSGFDFITQPAGFAIGESVIPFDSAESYGKAFIVGLSNTLRVAVVGIVLATILGTLIGIGRLSRNYLVRSLCTAYVELFNHRPQIVVDGAGRSNDQRIRRRIGLYDAAAAGCGSSNDRIGPGHRHRRYRHITGHHGA